MDDFLRMFGTYAAWIAAALAFLLALAIYLPLRWRINLWWLDFWYGLPLIGKLAQLSKDTTRSMRPGWLRAEETLCADYGKHILSTSEAVFRQRLEYLSRAQDLGRRPVPAWMLAVLAVLLVAEGLGFSYLLGTWMAREGSANVHTLLMLGIVLVLCIIMLVITHAAGHQLYRTGLVRRCAKEWRDQGQPGGRLCTEDIKLADDQSKDDAAAPCSRTINRVGSHAQYTMVAVAVAVIVLIAFLSTWLRISNLDGELVRETAIARADANPGNPFAGGGPVPAELAKPQQEADMRARAEALSSHRSEGMAAFVMLAVIFVVTQIVAIYAGVKYGFGGRESPAAHKGTRGFSLYDDYLDKLVDPVVNLAQARLQTLQRKLAASGTVRIDSHRTFDDYLRETDAARLQRREPVPAARPPAAPAAAAPQQPRAETFEEVLQILDAIPGKDARIAFVRTLPPDLQDRVLENRQAKKALEDEEARAAKMRDLL